MKSGEIEHFQEDSKINLRLILSTFGKGIESIMLDDQKQIRERINDFKLEYKLLVSCRKKTERYRRRVAELEEDMAGLQSPRLDAIRGSGGDNDSRLADMITQKMTLEEEIHRMMQQCEWAENVESCLPGEVRIWLSDLYSHKTTYPDIADKTGYSVSGIKKRIDRAILAAIIDERVKSAHIYKS